MKTVNKNNVWLPQLLDSLFFDSKLDFPTNFERFNVPAVNIIENSNNFVLELAAPGLEKEDFTISVEKDLLVIATKDYNEKIQPEANKEDVAEETNEEKVVEAVSEVEKVNYRKREFNFSKFKRSFGLSDVVNRDEIRANYENGVLKVTLPKVEEKVLKRMVEIS